ncbi:SRPBCC family protein [Variovorax fucosicus]|uniref:SRPBCC family protein n=1 Tax=Variovorax fucosicus TaxID=3053517 RepID=UPI00257568AD|nr:SRPBCC family protein [Variovorax sp. J22G47]MDM0058669.1 SRPBCC family protein [Variovorax sp. J22G47]
MASIRREMNVEADATQIWDAVRDVGALHQRLVKSFVVDCRLDGDDARIVKFANGMEARELIVDLDDAERRIVWSATGGRLTHHNASLQVFDEGGGRSRVVWLADLLPNALAPAIAGMIDDGMRAMKATLEAA